MTSQEWLDKAKQDETLLTQFVAEWHPRGTRVRKDYSDLDSLDSFDAMPITASGAEQACKAVRDSIRAKEGQQLAPEYLFKLALDKGDISELNSLLNSAWFGVPESTSCWQIPGFSEAVSLLEDPPEDEMI